MKKDNIDFCREQASIQETDEIRALRKVLDPRDTRGVKNSYLDFYLKHYLKRYLIPEEKDTLLEVGCGIGRVTEYMAQFAGSVYGIDIADQMIEACNSNLQKRSNTHYVKFDQREQLTSASINKMYIVWVLTLLADRGELIEMLSGYRKMLPQLNSAVILEQVKSKTHLKHHDRKFYGIYRTVDEYIDIFRASGFKVRDYAVLGERHHAPLYKLIHVLYRVLPRGLAKASPRLFLMDKQIMGDTAHELSLINDKRPTDVLFQLEVD